VISDGRPLLALYCLPQPHIRTPDHTVFPLPSRTYALRIWVQLVHILLYIHSTEAAIIPEATSSANSAYSPRIASPPSHDAESIFSPDPIARKLSFGRPIFSEPVRRWISAPGSEPSTPLPYPHADLEALSISASASASPPPAQIGSQEQQTAVKSIWTRRRRNEDDLLQATPYYRQHCSLLQDGQLRRLKRVFRTPGSRRRSSLTLHTHP
jgi:hypothetical protein